MKCPIVDIRGCGERLARVGAKNSETINKRPTVKTTHVTLTMRRCDGAKCNRKEKSV